MTAVQIAVDRGDITQVRVDAVVNAANPKMLGGGGVDGAIHRAAGPKLLEACRRVPARDGIRCPFGEARITEAFELPARYVIHAVGPIYSSSPDPESVLRSAYRSCMELAREHDLESIAFPAISTGAYGFPLEPAARIAIDAVSGEWGSVRQVRFVIFTDRVLTAFLEASAFG